MKQKFISIFILILLSSCSSATPAPTATALAVNTNTPLPTKPPTSAPTQTPAPTETPKIKVEALDISNPETFRAEEWEYLISPEYLANLEQREKAGELPSTPENPSYIKPEFVNIKYDDPASKMLNKYGVDTIFTLSNEIAYTNQNKRPFVIVDAAKTEVHSIKIILLVNKWVNSDGSHAFTGHFIFDYRDTVAWLGDIADPTRYLTGSYFVKNSQRGDGCKALIDQVSESTHIESADFCSYYYSHPDIFLPVEIYTKWRETGILNTNGSLPISVASSDAITR